MSGEFISREAVLIEAENVSLKDRNYRTYGNVVRSIPAADVVEVRHGRWIPKNSDGSWRVDTCSVCGKDTHYVRYAPAYDYCPNCGAKLDGGPDA